MQQQTIANKKRLVRRTAADPVAHRAYLLRASLIDSMRKHAAAAAYGSSVVRQDFERIAVPPATAVS